MKKIFKAFRIHHNNNTIQSGIEDITLDDLTEGEVVIDSHYSGVNYKDALAGTGRGKILRRYPLVGGIDVSGRVVYSTNRQFQEGDEVLVTGCGLSEIYDGGYAEYVRVPAQCVIALPQGLSLYEAMVMGTPALTAALALHRMEANNQSPDQGPILVTGASGGVGNLVLDIFSKQGYQLTALTSQVGSLKRLTALGANKILRREDLDLDQRPLEKGVWAGAVDMVGGNILSYLTRTTREWGNIASIGLAGGHELNTTVMPFILRGVSILGISSTNCPCELRKQLWQRLGGAWKPRHLDMISTSCCTLADLPKIFTALLDNEIEGRVVVSMKDSVAI